MRSSLRSPFFEQQTLPLPVRATSSGQAFCAYLLQHRLSPLLVAQASGLRYLTIWKMQQGLAVKPDQAILVRTCLWQMTGVAYTAPLAVLKEEHSPERNFRL